MRRLGLFAASVALGAGIWLAAGLLPPDPPTRCDVPTYALSAATRAYVRSHHLSATDCP